MPELAGCAAEGETYKALSNVEGVIDEWIETAKIKGREVGSSCSPDISVYYR